MSRSFPTFVLSCVLVLNSACLADEPLRPDSLVNWLRIIDVPNTRLLHAIDAEGYYFAIKMDADGDILFCEYHHEDRNSEQLAQYEIDVVDDTGRSLHNTKSTKKSPASTSVMYRHSSGSGVIRTTVATTVAYSRGVVLPLTRHDLATVSVEYLIVTESGSRKLLSQRVKLPMLRVTGKN